MSTKLKTTRMYGVERMVYRRPVNYFESRRIKIWKEIIELAESESYQALGEYLSSTTKMDFVCNKNHEFSMTPNDFKKGSRCPACARERITAAAIVTANKLKAKAAVRFTKYLSSKGYIAKSPYESSNKKITIQCSEGHAFTHHLLAILNYPKAVKFVTKKVKEFKN